VLLSEENKIVSLDIFKSEFLNHNLFMAFSIYNKSRDTENGAKLKAVSLDSLNLILSNVINILEDENQVKTKD
jgi:hypothetical protein